MGGKKKKVSEVTLIAIGLVIVFYNNIILFLQNVGGLVDYQARLLIFFGVLALVYYKTPWIKTIMRGDQVKV